jgi:hypothetical protein
MITDDPGTPGDGQWKINTAFMEDRTSGARVHSLPHIDINYGVGEHIQLKYETGYLFTDGLDTNGIRSDVDDSLLGIKWRFLDQDDAGADASLHPQLEVQNSHRSVRRGGRGTRSQLFLPLEVARAFGAVTIVTEVGYQYSSEQPNEWAAGLLAAIEVSEQLELMAELRSVSERLLNGGDFVLNIGLRQELGSHLKLLVSAGSGLRGGPDTTRFVGYLGMQLLLGNKK